MSVLNFQQISTVQSGLQPKPNTIASAATVVPSNFESFISGTTGIATITPPVDGAHLLVFIFTNGSPPSLLTTGNIVGGLTTITQNIPVFLVYDPNQAKYYPR